MIEDLFGNITTGPAPRGSLSEAGDHSPLAVRLRPRSLDEIIGQDHLTGPGSPLRRLVEGQPMSVFLWGPPGVGKTTIASVVSQVTGSLFVELSAVTAGVKEVRAALDTARGELARGRKTVLFIDEVHRFSKTQQDVLLPAVENRLVTLIAATTENPSFSVIAPLLSRSLVLTLQPLDSSELGKLIDRALVDERGLRTVQGLSYTLDDEVRQSLIQLGGGDGRRVLTYLEEAAATAQAQGQTLITPEILASAVDRAVVRYDADGDMHFDVISAFIKSIRGSDVQASLHYLARMISAGEDPRFIARRLMILASEDIGMASPQTLNLCVAVAQAVQLIGMPEGRIILAHGVIACATAPKSNAVITAIDSALGDVRAGKGGPVPLHLRDAHYSSAEAYGHGVDYLYAHDYPHGVAQQTYLPDDLLSALYYQPTDHGQEVQIAQRLEVIEDILGRVSGQ
jgi:putative ATPase